MLCGKIFSLASATRAKDHRAAVAHDLIQTITSEQDFLKKVITEDEFWDYSYDPEMKAQSSQWESSGSPHLKKVHQSHSKTKTVVTVVFLLKGVVHHKYTPPGQTINKEYCINVLHWLRDVIR